jgi:hypothetical protein
MRENGVEALLMGGQACILYGAAEFSRDASIPILMPIQKTTSGNTEEQSQTEE